MTALTRNFLLGAGALTLVAGGAAVTGLLDAPPPPSPTMVVDAPPVVAPAPPPHPAPPPPAATLATSGPVRLRLRVIEYVGGPKLEDWTVNGVTTSLASIFAAVNIEVVVDRQPAVAANFKSQVLQPEEMHNLLSSAPAAAPGEWQVTAHMLPISHADGDLGQLIDPIGRSHFAVFGPAHTGNDRVKKLLQTAAHELGHALNMVHSDSDGDRKCCGAQSGFTQIGTSVMNIDGCVAPGVGAFSLHADEKEHLLHHDLESVRPGSSVAFNQCTWPKIHRNLC